MIELKKRKNFCPLGGNVGGSHIHGISDSPQKNDALDAEAICEAAQRPNMRYAPLKSEAASAVLSMHRTRRQFVKQRTMNVNHVRAACAEFGLIAPLGAKGHSILAERLRSDDESVPAALKASQRPVLEVIEQLDRCIGELGEQIHQWHKSSEASQRLAKIPGVGVHSATYLAAVLGDGSAYRNGRQFAASLGLVPRQWSTGGRQKLGGITKAGDPHLRSLLYEGALSVIFSQLRAGPKVYPGTVDRVQEKSPQVVAIELANRHARQAWSMIANGEEYDPSRKRAWPRESQQ